MAEGLHRASITHTEKTIQQLYKTQYYAYGKRRMLLRMALGLARVAAALLAAVPAWARALLLLLGCWLLASRDFPASVRADRALSERKASLPVMKYVFEADGLHLQGEGSMDIPYGKFTRLAEDNGYFYLFVSRDSVCMLERASLQPKQEEAFKAFVGEKTGLTWRREKSILSLNLYDLRQLLRDLKEK